MSFLPLLAETNSLLLAQALFNKGKYTDAVEVYTQSAELATTRLPWENAQIMQEELFTALSKRTLCYLELHKYIYAMADAETLISIRRNGIDGHFMKAKALAELGEYQEAVDALYVGLAFEPKNAVRFYCH